MRKSAYNKQVKELTEVIAAAVAERPDLQHRLSTVLGAGSKTPVPTDRNPTMAEMMADERKLFNQLYYEDKIKQQLKKTA